MNNAWLYWKRPFLNDNEQHLRCFFVLKGGENMPKTKFQDFIYTIIMVIVMVYAMVFYNIINMEGPTNKAFLLALKELPIMGVIAFLLEFFIIGKLANKITLKFMDFKTDKPIFIILSMSCIIVAFMCPIMSLIGSLLLNYNGLNNIIINWLSLTIKNFPMALFWQIFYAGPFVRFIFKKIFKN